MVNVIVLMGKFVWVRIVWIRGIDVVVREVVYGIKFIR